MSRVFLAGNFGHSFFPTKEAFDVLWILFKTTVQRAILKFSALYAFHELIGKQLSGSEKNQSQNFLACVSLWILRNPFRKHYADSKFEVLCSGFASGIAFIKLCFKKIEKHPRRTVSKFWCFENLSAMLLCATGTDLVYIYIYMCVCVCVRI